MRHLIPVEQKIKTSALMLAIGVGILANCPQTVERLQISAAEPEVCEVCDSAAEARVHFAVVRVMLTGAPVTSDL